MKVTVTQEDIDGGYRHNAEMCPLSFAIERGFEEGAKVRVDCGGAVSVWPMDGGRTDYELPADAARAVAVYDATGRMEPFEFDMGLAG